MGIRSFFDKTVVVLRLKSLGGGKKAMNTTATVDMAIQELDRQDRSEMEIVQDRAWQAYFDIEDDNRIVEGDKIVDGYGTEYKVIEKTRKDYGVNQHIEVILIEYNA